MSVVLTDIRTLQDGKGANIPARASASVKVAMIAETDTGWIKKQNFGLTHFQWPLNPALTVKFYGRNVTNGGAAQAVGRIADKDGVPILLDLSIGDAADGSTMILDTAAGYDEIKAVFSANTTANYFFGFNG